MKYFFYILRCSDNSLYCGMTNNLENRLRDHNGSKGAKYLRAKKPFQLVYSEEYPDIKSAMQRELQVKKWTKVKKEALIQGNKSLLKNVITLSERSESKGTKATKEVLVKGDPELLKKL